jgi:DnaJ homolog subfamily C member 9
LAAYEEGEGDLDFLYENVMLSNVLEDDERFRRIIDEGIANGDVKAYAAYKKESRKKREARKKAAKAEEEEAEEMARELGVHDKLFGGDAKERNESKKKGKGKKEKGSGEDALKALIQQRSQGRLDSLIDSLETKYGGGSKSKKGKKTTMAPTDEEFEAAAAKLGKRKGEETSSGKASKRGRR